MQEDLERYLKNVKKANLKKLEKKVESFVIDPSGQPRKYEIKFRSNPVFFSKARIVPEREGRKIETISLGFKSPPTMECIFCDPKNKAAKFISQTGLEEQYYLNSSAAFSNLYTFGKIHGVVIFNYRQHVKDPSGLNAGNWLDGIKLIQKIGKLSKNEYVSMGVNCGYKAGSSLEHFHGQFNCEDEPLAKTSLAMKTGNKKFWKSWVKAMMEEGLVIDYDKESKTVFFVEWSPSFGKIELVVMNLENPSFKNMSDKEASSVARFIDRAAKTVAANISDQFNIVNLSASSKDSFCNQFRIFPRAPSSHGIKAWEGYLEFSGETVPHINPESLIEIVKKSEKLSNQL
jgi:diadenosine tetraphosphate (Ap4A) HIT family hydrolase